MVAFSQEVWKLKLFHSVPKTPSKQVNPKWKWLHWDFVKCSEHLTVSLIRQGLHTSEISPMQENLTSFTSLPTLHAASSTSPGRTHPSCGHSAKKAVCFEYKPAFQKITFPSWLLNANVQARGQRSLLGTTLL